MNIKSDSRKINKGDTFIAIRGVNTDGHDYIEMAIKNGASTIIAEEGFYSVETIIVKNTRKYYAKYLKNKYSYIFKKVKLIGITGTNGKTTSCYLINQLLNNLGEKSAYIGTIGFYLDGEVRALNNTTPDLPELYEMFDEAYNRGVTTIVMEVSSHALVLGRVEGIKFDYVAFTNLTKDHTDIHKTMRKYMLAKKLLFKKLLKNGWAIINADDPFYKNFLLKDNNNTLIGTNSKANYKIEDCSLEIDKCIFSIEIDKKIYNVTLNIPGKYNIYNFVTALAILNKYGFNIEDIVSLANKLTPPPGRMDSIKHKSNVIIVDYAHTPDALLNVLTAVISYKTNKVTTIVGCGGDRDKTKRPIMGEIATNLSDHVIFTNDNPRTEDEKEIMNDIVSDLKRENYEIIFDRKEAIKKGIDLLKDKDILLILGKGHEDYQIIGKEKIHFSDKDIVIEYIKNK